MYVCVRLMSFLFQKGCMVYRMKYAPIDIDANIRCILSIKFVYFINLFEPVAHAL